MTTTRRSGTAATTWSAHDFCPRCHRVDRVNTVKRVHEANTRTTRIRAEHIWAGLLLGTSRADSVTTTKLGEYLKPPPRRPHAPYGAWLWARFCCRCYCVYFAPRAAAYGAMVGQAVAPERLARVLRELPRA